MPRPLKAIRPVEKTINLPQTICTQVDLLLFSEFEQRVPYGAWAKYVQGLIEADIARKAAEQEAARKLPEQGATFEYVGVNRG